MSTMTRDGRAPLSAGQQTLALRYLPLARKLARPFKAAWPALRDDFDSAACLALVEAASSFDPERNVKFATFACYLHGDHAGPRLADHLYLVFSTPPEGLDNDEFVAWYQEHADENTQVPGFVANWRFRLEPALAAGAANAPATHLAIYEVERDLATLRANLGAAAEANKAGWPAWFNPEPWTSLDANAVSGHVAAPAASTA